MKFKRLMSVKKAMAIGPMCIRRSVHRPSGYVFKGFAALMLFSYFRRIKLSEPSVLSLRAFLISCFSIFSALVGFQLVYCT